MLLRLRHHARLLIALSGLLLATATLFARQAADPKPIVQNYLQAMVTAPPATLALDPFYKKYADAYGIPIVSLPRLEETGAR
jgi:hypothetical protein